MKLCEHPDFGQAITRAREHFGRTGLTEQLIEKDYYVTEALRIVATAMPDQVIFKGGTSLSKGWGLIERFSEDLDLFVNPQSFAPPLSTRGIDRSLAGLRDMVGGHPGLWHDAEASQKLGGKGRSDYFMYRRQFAGAAAVAPRVLLEVGTSSGTYPTETRWISSYVSDFLKENGLTLGTDDEDGFEMPLLHFRRTFVEKMFAIHAKVEFMVRQGSPLRTFARHYYDLYCLAQRPEVTEMLRSEEYAEIKQDYEHVSLASFPRGYVAPPEMRFANSQALFPPPDLRPTIAADYEEQCRILCYGHYPPWDEVEQAFERLRPLI
ncbi:MAG: nucleotidyl transferase AbiEii/AbiGii toxin family protein [Patescibacteria group bacterium]|nr:nucleotidyl transferase AbiEii/AbiGii toxin family protein [Patescibacteria group bacterium]